MIQIIFPAINFQGNKQTLKNFLNPPYPKPPESWRTDSIAKMFQKNQPT